MQTIIIVLIYYAIITGITYFFRNKIKLPEWKFVQILTLPGKSSVFVMKWMIVMLIATAFFTIVSLIL